MQCLFQGIPLAKDQGCNLEMFTIPQNASPVSQKSLSQSEKNTRYLWITCWGTSPPNPPRWRLRSNDEDDLEASFNLGVTSVSYLFVSDMKSRSRDGRPSPIVGHNSRLLLVHAQMRRVSWISGRTVPTTASSRPWGSCPTIQ